MQEKKISPGVWLAIAGLVTSAPRLVLVLLASDGIEVPTSIHAALMTATGIGTAIVLSGSGAYITHTLGLHWKSAGNARMLLVPSWFGMLIGMVILLSPPIAVGLEHTEFGAVLSWEGRLLWAFTSIVCVELMVCGVMVADAIIRNAKEDSSEVNLPALDLSFYQERVHAQETQIETMRLHIEELQGRYSAMRDSLADRRPRVIAQAPAAATPMIAENRQVVRIPIPATSQDAIAPDATAQEAAPCAMSKRAQAFALLDADPTATNSAIAASLGISQSNVRVYRSQYNGSKGVAQ